MKTPSENQSEIDSEIQLAFEKLGLRPSDFRDEPNPPQVDRDVLGELASQRLDESSAKLVLEYVVRFKPWREAFCEILVGQLRDK